ncbi:MAG: twin-arginine translocase subunit TatB [Pseudomonadota bacterium]|jgi:sec-independent protein translocase protein TatB
MFDVGFDELLVIVIVAIVVIGPKDLPKALRIAGQWIGKVRRVSGHFRSGVEAMIREAELEEMERKWREQNAAIMAAHPDQTPEEAMSSAGTASPALPEGQPAEDSPPAHNPDKA